jgi:hypothetical protein
MSVLVPEAAPPVPAGASWSQVGPALWVASTRGEFVGTVEEVDGRFVACDHHAVEIGIHADLQAAKQQVLRPAPAKHAVRGRIVEPDETALAWVTAAVGAAVIIGCLLMITWGLS